MRLLPLLALLVSLPLTTGCHLGGKSSNLQASAKSRSKETWSKPKFARSKSSGDASEVRSRMLEAAHAAARSGRLAEARRLYGRVLDSDPRNAGAHHGLAILADRERDFGIAETHYLAALEERPRDPDLLNDVGYSYLQQERFPEAKQLFVRALEFDPGHQLATSNLGHVNAATGRLDEALALFRRVGTEEQARAEVAKYVESGIASGGDRLRVEAVPGNAEDVADWSLEELQARRDEARLAGIAARRRRTEQIDYERLAAIDREETANEFAIRPDTPADPGFERNPFEPRDPRAVRDEAVRTIGFETPDPRGSFDVGNEAPETRFESPTPDFERGFDPPGRDRTVAGSPSRGEFGVPKTGGGDLWPPDGGQNRGGPNRGATAGAAPDPQPAGHRTLPPWPGTHDTMDSRSPTGSQRDSGELVIRPNAIQQQAAILGLNAGSGLPIPIESTSRTANRRAFDRPGPALRSDVAPQGTTAPRHVTPPPGRVRQPARAAPQDADPGPVAPEPWSGTAAQSVPRTTSMVPIDPSLYRAANGRPVGYERAEAPYGRAGDANGRIEDWADARHDFDAEQAALAAERRAFRGGGAPRADFPADFGPPTTTPSTRRAGDGW